MENDPAAAAQEAFVGTQGGGSGGGDSDQPSDFGFGQGKLPLPPPPSPRIPSAHAASGSLPPLLWLAVAAIRSSIAPASSASASSAPGSAAARAFLHPRLGTASALDALGEIRPAASVTGAAGARLLATRRAGEGGEVFDVAALAGEASAALAAAKAAMVMPGKAKASKPPMPPQPVRQTGPPPPAGASTSAFAFARPAAKPPLAVTGWNAGKVAPAPAAAPPVKAAAPPNAAGSAAGGEYDEDGLRVVSDGAPPVEVRGHREGRCVVGCALSD